VSSESAIWCWFYITVDGVSKGALVQRRLTVRKVAYQNPDYLFLEWIYYDPVFLGIIKNHHKDTVMKQPVFFWNVLSR